MIILIFQYNNSKFIDESTYAILSYQQVRAKDFILMFTLEQVPA